MQKEEEELAEQADKSSVPKYCTADIWRDGWSLIKAMNVRGVRRAEEARLERKNRVHKYIVGRVRAMKKDMSAITLLGKNEQAEEASWTTYVRRVNQK